MSLRVVGSGFGRTGTMTTKQALETLAVARYAVGEQFEKAWDKEQQPDQWQALADVIAARSPQRIAVNFSEHFALGDGISSTEYRKLMAALPQPLRGRVVSGSGADAGRAGGRALGTFGCADQQCLGVLPDAGRNGVGAAMGGIAGQ